MLAVERRTSLIFGRNDSLNCSEVALTERVVLRAKETFTPSIGLLGIDPIVHDTPTYERPYPLRPIPCMQQQSIAVVRSIVDREISLLPEKKEGPSRIRAIKRGSHD